jgi:hypothetical protein
MVLLLGSRGQYRGRRSSGLVGTLRRVGHSALELVGFRRPNNNRRGETRASRGSTVSGWLALGAALAFFGVGYLIGRSTAGPAATGNGVPGAVLNANGGQPVAPALIDDTTPLGSQAFIVSAYPDLDPTAARGQAKALSEWLRGQQPLLKARPYEYTTKDGPLWVVAVYYDGENEQAETRKRLRGLPEDVPDWMFVAQRKKDSEDWPLSKAIR